MSGRGRGRGRINPVAPRDPTAQSSRPLVYTKEKVTDPTVALEKRFALLKPVAVRLTRFAGGTCYEEVCLTSDQGQKWYPAVEVEALLALEKSKEESDRLIGRAASRLKKEVSDVRDLTSSELKIVKLSKKEWEFHSKNPDREKNLEAAALRKAAQESGDSKVDA